MRRLDLQLFAEERQEPATPHRRQEARRRGQVFRSVEISSAVLLLAVLGVVQATGSRMESQFIAMARLFWGGAGSMDWSPAGVAAIGQGLIRSVLDILWPILLTTAAVGVAMQLAQTGFVFSVTPLWPDWQRVNPGQGLLRLMSPRSVAELVKSLFKLVFIGAVAWMTVRGAHVERLALNGGSVEEQVAFAGRLVKLLMWRTALGFLVLGAADYFYQRWEYEKSLRMSREEIRNEAREGEGDPQLKARRRQRQRELSRQRMLADVAKADVVITNPTHYAVALRYDPGAMDAPRLVAKGRGFLAGRIRSLAREHGVVIMEDPPLARTLYKLVAIGQSIPEELYQAVAEVLAFVWRLKGKA